MVTKDKLLIGVGIFAFLFIGVYGWRSFSARIAKKKNLPVRSLREFSKRDEKPSFIGLSKKQISKEIKKSSDSIEKIKKKPKLRNPFLPPGEEIKKPEISEAKPPKKSLDVSNFSLEAIFYSSHRKVAVINGRIVKENDGFLGAKLLRIEPRKVVLEFEGEEYTLGLKDVKR